MELIYLVLIPVLLPIAWIAGTYYVCTFLGLNITVNDKREAIFNARNEFRNNNRN